MKKILAGILCFCFIFTACSGSGPATWQEQYDLGMRYLSEGNYEEAIIAFTAAIEIDPKRVEAYLQLAEVYLQLGDYSTSIETLENGYNISGNETIREKMEEVKALYPVEEDHGEVKPENEVSPDSEVVTENEADVESGDHLEYHIETEQEPEPDYREQETDRMQGEQDTTTPTEEDDTQENEIPESKARTEQITYAGDGSGYGILEYDDNGVLIRETAYYADDSVWFIRENDSFGKPTKYTVWYLNGDIQRNTEYLNGKTTLDTQYHQGGNPWIITQYDANEIIQEETQFYSNGELFCEKKYDRQGNLAEQIVYDGNGAVFSHEEYGASDRE